MAELKTITKTENNTHITTVIGQIDESTVEIFSTEIYKTIESCTENSRVIIDLEQVTYLNSKSIGYIADFFNRLESKNSKLILAKAQPNIKDILNVVGIDQIVTMTQTLNEAKTI